MANSQNETLGTININPPLFSVRNAPAIVFEWVALIPLVIYLVSYGYSRRLVGRTSLAGSINVGFFPRLGVLENVACLIKEGSDYLDRACSVSEFRKEVWDVNWGSQFPCANGSASDIIFSHALKSAEHPILATVEMPKSPISGEASTNEVQKMPKFSRPQILHVIRCSRESSSTTGQGNPPQAATGQDTKWLYNLGSAVVLLGGGTAAFTFGLYGTFAAALISAAFQLARLSIIVQLSGWYLMDNEKGKIPGCMLVANHQNASTWVLFCGDRGVIDGILNKNMIFSIESRSSRKLGSSCLIVFLRLLAVLQILALTYVAAQKGWDGVGLLVFVVVAGIYEDVIQQENHLARGWAKRYGVHFESKSFEFKGRVSMIGAIQIYKLDPTRTWMDSILVPSQRRDIWLKMLRERKFECEDDDPIWKGANEEVKSWVRFNMATSKAAAKVMEDKLPLFSSNQVGATV